MKIFITLLLSLLSGFTIQGGSASGATGSIEIATIGENTVDPTASAPFVDVWVDSASRSVKTKLIAGLRTGKHTARSELRHGLVQSVGTCTYTEGRSPCTVSSFTDISPSDCDLTKCNKEVTVSASTVTKVVFKHRGVYEGWGNNKGGSDGSIITVSNLNASGRGSFRQALLDACSSNNRYITFSVGGTVTLIYSDISGLNNGLRVCGHNITVDGFTAPHPGITITQYGLNIHVLGPGGLSDPKATHDIILRGFRIRKGGFSRGNCDGVEPDDCEPQVINIETGLSRYDGPNRVHHLVIDHLSISGGRDDTVGVSSGSHDITLSWNYLSAGAASHQGYLMDSGSYNVTQHHNRYSKISRRNPQITYHDVNTGSTSTTTPSTISADIRYNTIVLGKESSEASQWGLLVAGGAKVNAIKNYFTTDSSLKGDDFGLNNAIIVCNPGSRWLNGSAMNTCDFCSKNDACRRSSDVYLDGNTFVSPHVRAPAIDLNTLDVNVSSPISSPTVIGEATATLAACAVRQKGGMRPLDSHDITQESYYANPC